MASLDLDLVRHALKTAQDHAFGEVELASDGASFRARFEAGLPRRTVSGAVAGESALVLAVEDETQPIKSTLVGFFHWGDVKLELGAKVRRGDVVGVINALGIASDLESPVSGEVVEVFVDDDQPVEFGEVLAKVK